MPFCPVQIWKQEDGDPSEATSFTAKPTVTIEGLQQETVFLFRVRSRLTNGHSPWSQITEGVTVENQGKAAASSVLRIANTTASVMLHMLTNMLIAAIDISLYKSLSRGPIGLSSLTTGSTVSALSRTNCLVLTDSYSNYLAFHRRLNDKLCT